MLRVTCVDASYVTAIQLDEANLFFMGVHGTQADHLHTTEHHPCVKRLAR